MMVNGDLEVIFFPAFVQAIMVLSLETLVWSMGAEQIHHIQCCGFPLSFGVVGISVSPSVFRCCPKK